MKICSKCKIEKDLEEFHKKTKSKDGRASVCKVCQSIYKKQYYQTNKNKILKQIREYYENNKQAIKEHRIAYDETNNQYIQKRNKQYYLTMKNDERFKIKRKNIQYKRRALEKEAGHFTAAEWREVLQKYGAACLHCGSTEHLTVDHVIPLSKGGLNIKENLQPLCITHNCSKGTKTIDYRTPTHINLIATI